MNGHKALLFMIALMVGATTMASAQRRSVPIQSQRSAFQNSSSVRTPTNPDISLIGDFRAWYDSEGDRNLDAALSEIETSYKSVIDPFARADIYVGIAQEDGEFEFELEEAYITTLSLPYQLQARVGKFRSNVGKINRTHTHALPHSDIPAVYANFLGDEGLNDEGISLSWLVPNDRFYQEASFEVTRGPDENVSFARSEENSFMYTAHLKNYWDLSDNASLELGVSGLSGDNAAGFTTQMAMVDVTYKWKPLQFNTYQSFTLQAEYLFSRMDTGDGDIEASGWYALANYQLARRWFLIGRYDNSDVPDNPEWNENGVSGTLGWYLSEFQKLQFGLKSSWGDEFDQHLQATVGLIFVIGTHGAHEY